MARGIDSPPRTGAKKPAAAGLLPEPLLPITLAAQGLQRARKRICVPSQRFDELWQPPGAARPPALDGVIRVVCDATQIRCLFLRQSRCKSGCPQIMA